jgi:arginine repressor
MRNYGWVQNTSNLSTIRDTIELVLEDGMNHNALMRAIYSFRAALGEIKKKWTWDARCRIKAICASGMVEIDRIKQGYHLTSLGKELCNAPKSDTYFRRMRILTHEEVEIFRRGLLTNPPVISVLNIINESKKRGVSGLSKYDVGSQLGFVGDVGFTHFEAEYVIQNGRRFNDAEGDADKWARTIISWLMQVGWVINSGSRDVYGESLALYTTTNEVDKVLQYAARSTVKYVPQEMLCSDHHPFAEIIQRRRVSILRILSQKSIVPIVEMVESMRALDIDTDEETLAFDIINLRQAGIQISKERSYYRLIDKIKLDIPTQEFSCVRRSVDGVEKQIEHFVTIYADSIPTRLVDNIIRYGYDGTKSAALFEMTIDKLFSFMGYESKCLGQGQGRVADIVAKYRDAQPPKLYAVIIDVKAYERYSFPAGDVRKMKEYISFHGNDLYQDRIPRHAFAFISMAFTNINEKLEEIANDTAVSGTAIDVYTLLELSSKVSQQQVSIAGLYPSFTTNRQFVLP